MKFQIRIQNQKVAQYGSSLYPDLQHLLNHVPGFHFPMNFMEGVQVDYQKLSNDWISLETVEDYEHVITR